MYIMLNIYKLKKNNIKNLLLNKKGNVIDESKYYPSFTNEWSNSVYFFNKKNELDLISKDKLITNIIKSYFYMFSSSLERSIRIRKKAIWKRRFKLNRILVAKPEFKHTNDKITITLFIYNRELAIFKHKINKFRRQLFAKYFSKIFINNLMVFNRIKIIKSLLNKINSLKTKIKKLKNKRVYLIKKVKNKTLNNQFIKTNKSYKKSLLELLNVWNKYNKIKSITQNKSNNMIFLAKSLSRFEKSLKSKNSVLNQSSRIIISLLCFFNTKYNLFINKQPNIKIKNYFYINFFKNLVLRMRLYIRLNRIIKFNKFKFNIYIKPLKIYLEKLYNKTVDFNIINLKSYHLNSSILTNVIAIKLRNRKNKLLTVLDKSLSVIKLPLSRKLEYSSEIDKGSYLQNIIIRQYLNKYYLYKNPVYNKDINNKIGKLSLIKINSDKLDMIIKSICLSDNTTNSTLNVYKRKYKNIVLDSISNKSILGIKLEGSGRLTKRISADRSMFKMKQKGTIRNINSSYKRIPSVLLRGNFKSNLQYSFASNKTRIGSFGIKGWVSSI